MSALASYSHDAERDLGAWSRDMAGVISRKLSNAGSRLQPQAQQYVSHDVSQNSQLNAPSQRPQHGEDGADMLPPTNGRNTRVLTVNREQTRDTLTERFKVHVTEPSKVAARKLGKSAETVDAYRQVGVPMSWADMVECCRRYPAFALDVVEAMGLDIDRDRESYALFLSLQLRMTERR